MPVDIRIMHDGLGIMYVCYGNVSGVDFIEANKQLLSSKDQLKKVIYGLVDETAIENLQISESEMLTIAAQNKKMSAVVPGRAIVAVIAKDDPSYQLARVWEGFIEHTGWETTIFRTRWKAERWITEKVKTNFGIDLIFGNGIAVG
jgi:hypothetical protein